MDDLRDFYSDDLPNGWEVWSEEDGLVICYKPNVFNGGEFPPVCLPTISAGRSERGGWKVSFYIEADVEARRLRKEFKEYSDAVNYIVDLTEKFNKGNFDIKDFYAKGDVRKDYVEKIEKEIK